MGRGAHGRMRCEADDALINLEMVFVALEPSPIVGAVEGDTVAVERCREVVIGEIGIHRAPRGREYLLSTNEPTKAAKGGVHSIIAKEWVRGLGAGLETDVCLQVLLPSF